MGIAGTLGQGRTVKWWGVGCFQLSMCRSLADPRLLTASVLPLFFWLHAQRLIHSINDSIAVNEFGYKTMEIIEAALCSSVGVLHSSLQGCDAFAVMVAKHNQTTSFSVCCWLGLAAKMASRGHFSFYTVPTHGLNGFGWHRSDLSSLLQTPCRTAWPCPSKDVSLLWRRLDRSHFLRWTE